ncbi:MAG TPA: nucleotidyltransferase family protein [Ktedonobacterales bacterium]|nr:nucleotidyltransferase family protein [Ktedonobacterales bacterium]
MAEQPLRHNAVIVLAGGRSSRMGAHKLLLPLGEAPVIARSAQAALASGLRPVVMVVGHGSEQVRAALAALPIVFALNAAYHEGIATSLRTGIAALDDTVGGAVIMLGDQPLVPAAHLAALATHARATDTTIVATRYPDHTGSPIYFGRQAFADLLRLRGDEGARSLIASGTYAVSYLPLADPDAAFDIDTPEDYERVRGAWQRRGER